MRSIFCTTIVFTLISIFSISCCKDQCTDPTDINCSNYDPCYGVMKTSAEFDILRKLSTADTTYWFSVDTLYNRSFGSGSIYYFKASEESETYQWRIGTDPTVYTTKDFSLAFENITGLIDIELIVSRTPNTSCFPDDSGLDTIVKTIYAKPFFDYQADAPLFGDFQGSCEHEPDSIFTMRIRHPDIQDFPRGCINAFMPVYSSFDRFVFDDFGQYGCGHPIGEGHLVFGNHDSLIINYELKSDGIQKVFKGIRIE